VAKAVLTALLQGYRIDPSELKYKSDRIVSKACPQRNGPSHNLAGVILESPAMASSAVYGCAYRPSGPAGDSATLPIAPTKEDAGASDTADGLESSAMALEQSLIAQEIARLSSHIGGARTYAIFDAGVGYLQCEPIKEDYAIYCEAASAESDPALAAVLTAQRVAALRAAGFTEPGLRQNYWRYYKLSEFSDDAIAAALLGLLRDVYGYDGFETIQIEDETGISRPLG
jgi:hypothetical protein